MRILAPPPPPQATPLAPFPLRGTSHVPAAPAAGGVAGVPRVGRGHAGGRGWPSPPGAHYSPDTGRGRPALPCPALPLPAAPGTGGGCWPRRPPSDAPPHLSARQLVLSLALRRIPAWSLSCFITQNPRETTRQDQSVAGSQTVFLYFIKV